MFSKPWRLFVPAGLLALGLAGLHGQQPQPKTGGAPLDTGTVFRADTRRVICHTTVLDKAGHLVTNLKQEAFTIFENDIKQDILLFKREDVPVSMGLIIDNSGSMRAKRSSVEAAALALVKDSNPDDEVFIVNFNDDAFIDNPHGKEFLTSIEEMQEALTRIDSRGGTAMRDAIDKSIEWLKKAHKDKKVLVVVTDGVDNASSVPLEDLVRNARQSEVLIYSVGLLTEEEKRSAASAKRQLNTLTEATGGVSFYPKELAEVDRIAHEVARDIRSQYTIGYKPSNEALDGTYRRIKVTVKAPGNPTPRTRTGYYATADQGAPAPKVAPAVKGAPAPRGKEKK
jgi:VWFA-related protein